MHFIHIHTHGATILCVLYCVHVFGNTIHTYTYVHTYMHTELQIPHHCS